MAAVETLELTSNNHLLLPGDDQIKSHVESSLHKAPSSPDFLISSIRSLTKSEGADPLLVQIVVDAAHKSDRAQIAADDEVVVIRRLDLVAEAFGSFSQMILRNREYLDERKYRRLQVSPITGAVMGKKTLYSHSHADAAAYFAIRAWVNAFIHNDMKLVL